MGSFQLAMPKGLGKIHHCVRYFVLLGILFFVAYIKQWADGIFFFLIGPCVHVAYYLKSILVGIIPFIPKSSILINQYAFLLPVTLIYGIILGTFYKHLWNEKGKIRWIGLMAFSVFLVYIHFLSGSDLLDYLTVSST